MARIAILGTNIANAATSNVSVTVGTAVPAGSLVVLGAAFENGAGAVPAFTSVTDSRSNTYNGAFDASAGAGNTTVCCAIVAGLITTALQVSDTITLTIGTTRTRWAVEADAFDDITSATADKTQKNDNPGSATSLSTGATGTLSQPRELVVAAFGSGVRTYTQGSGFTGGPSVDTTAGSTDRSLFLEYKYVEDSTPTTQTGTASINSASTYCGCVATYRSWVPAGHPVIPRGAVVRAARW